MISIQFQYNICHWNHWFVACFTQEATEYQLQNHSIQINALSYLPVGEGNIPTGEIASVNGTKFDLRVTQDLNQLLINDPTGYDHNFCLNEDEDEVVAAV